MRARVPGHTGFIAKECVEPVKTTRKNIAGQATERAIPIGAHLVTPRGGYEHHGVYVGNGKVVHYAGFCETFQRGPIEEVSLARFCAGHGYQVVAHPAPHFSGADVAARARSRVGEDAYRLLTNNCEHLVNWCIDGAHRSLQIRRCLINPVRGARAAASLIQAYLKDRKRLALRRYAAA